MRGSITTLLLLGLLFIGVWPAKTLAQTQRSFQDSARHRERIYRHKYGITGAVLLPEESALAPVGGASAWITFAQDSVAEMYSLIYSGKRVAGNNAANKTFVGGAFMIPKQYGPPLAQEEALMALFDGLLSSLLNNFAQRHPDGSLIRDRADQKRARYHPGTLSHAILFSKWVRPRVDRDVWNEFNRRRSAGSKDFFSTYVANEYYKNHTVWTTPYPASVAMNMYSMAALNRRGRQYVDYPRLEENTYNMIATMLVHARKQQTQAVVVTVPGSGVFSYDENGILDEKYLRTVRRATMNAVHKYGAGFEKIVVCGYA